jgi:hypothetical protein
MQSEHSHGARRRLWSLNIRSYAWFAVGAMVLLCVVALLFFSDPLANAYLRPRITEAFAEAYPAYTMRIAHMHYNVLNNRFGFDSVGLSAVDGTVSGMTGYLSVSGIGLKHMLWRGRFAPDELSDAVLSAHDVVLTFHREQYELRCRLLRVSVPDSDVVVDSLTVQPPGDDEQFFAVSQFRRTRFRVVVPNARVRGLATLELLEGKSYGARSATLHGMLLDVLIDKEKPYAEDTTTHRLPTAILSSIRGTLQVDSLRIMDGGVRYGERYASGARPALITIDSMDMLAEGIANHGARGAAVVVGLRGTFMKAAAMHMGMSIPVASPEFSFTCYGSLGSMDLRVVNAFLETAEQMRIKAGFLQGATFDMRVDSGRASGSVRAAYKDLNLAAINRRTGSEKGVADGIATFIASTFKIRGINMPDHSGMMKIGEVKYVRKREDVFLECTWFALRSGVGDIVGF